MLIREVMSKPVTLLTPDNTLDEAARKMKAEDVGSLPVGENDRLVGMLTDRDIVVRGIAAGKDPVKTPIREAMSEGILYCMETDSIEKVADIMAKKQVRRLPVISAEKRLVGIVSIGDLATNGSKKKAGEALSEVASDRH
jgi:CBS domain-containing protein